tara:strand:- start:106 stop:210 length:105 start_codon:yes stop_codon:yes gene_type:complete
MPPGKKEEDNKPIKAEPKKHIILLSQFLIKIKYA